MSGIKNYSLSEQEYLDHKINFNFSLENKKQIVSNVARQFKEGKLTKDTEIQAAVQKLVFDAGPKMDAEAK